MVRYVRKKNYLILIVIDYVYLSFMFNVIIEFVEWNNLFFGDYIF